jgi:hypothetical protein
VESSGEATASGGTLLALSWMRSILMPTLPAPAPDVAMAVKALPREMFCNAKVPLGNALMAYRDRPVLRPMPVVASAQAESCRLSELSLSRFGSVSFSRLAQAARDSLTDRPRFPSARPMLVNDYEKQNRVD